MLEKFEDWKPRQNTLDILNAAIEAAEDMADYEPTLRTIYYQLVAGKVIENKQSEYDRLGSIVTKARNAGMFDWYAITDKGRGVRSYFSEENPIEAITGCESFISFDYWARQPIYVEVWVEKQAQEGVVRKVCQDYKVSWLSCKGYLSASASYNAGKRYADAVEDGKRPVLIHLGDHDPSGIDMTRDNQVRVEKYGWLEGVEVRRIALNMDQVEEHKLPPDPAKMTDTRAGAYVARHGKVSWELDALKPQILEPIIRQAVTSCIDLDIWHQTQANEREVKSSLRWIDQNPERVLQFAQQQNEA